MTEAQIGRQREAVLRRVQRDFERAKQIVASVLDGYRASFRDANGELARLERDLKTLKRPKAA